MEEEENEENEEDEEDEEDEDGVPGPRVEGTNILLLFFSYRIFMFEFNL